MANPFKGMGGMPDPTKMISKMKADGEKMQALLDAARVDGSSGGGMVKAVADGNGRLIELSIAPEAVDPSDVEILQDMVISAVREALDKSEEMRLSEQQKLIPAGLNIPGLF